MFLGVSAAFLFFLVNLGYLAAKTNELTLTGRTTGMITGRETSLGIKQTLMGNKRAVSPTVVTYSYEVNGKLFVKKELINYSVMGRQEVDRLYYGNLPLKVKICYRKSSPEDSAIVLE